MDREYNQIFNLIKFTVNFSEYAGMNSLDKQSPDYILEKFNHWIGFKPNCKFDLDDDVIKEFISSYEKIWGESINIMPQLFYLYYSKSLNIDIMVSTFNKYIGDISNIRDYEQKGLHEKIETDLIPKIKQIQEKRINTILRELKINNIVKS